MKTGSMTVLIEPVFQFMTTYYFYPCLSVRSVVLIF